MTRGSISRLKLCYGIAVSRFIWLVVRIMPVLPASGYIWNDWIRCIDVAIASKDDDSGFATVYLCDWIPLWLWFVKDMRSFWLLICFAGVVCASLSLIKFRGEKLSGIWSFCTPSPRRDLIPPVTWLLIHFITKNQVYCHLFVIHSWCASLISFSKNCETTNLMGWYHWIENDH